jgi:hypothetical protein
MKHKIQLAENWNSEAPFMTGWDTNLIGGLLREEFSQFIEQIKEERHIIPGGSKKINVSDELKKFMIRKRVNLVDDPATGTLKSQFVLKPGEEMEIDDLAWESLSKFEYQTKKTKDGSELEPTGFILHEAIGGKDPEKPIEVSGEKIQYFESEKPEEKIEEKNEEPAKVYEFVCPKCGKGFDTKLQLHGHSLNH